jgi:hypothetical protein
MMIGEFFVGKPFREPTENGSPAKAIRNEIFRPLIPVGSGVAASGLTRQKSGT